MEKIKTIIIDDEPLAIELLSDYVNKCDFLELVYTTNKPLEALSYIGQNKIDLILLDVRMKEIDGLQFIKVLNRIIPIILITAHPDYAIQGYEMNVVDYLLKPVQFERFLQAAQKVMQQVSSGKYLAEKNLQNGHREEALFVKSKYKIVKLLIKNILFIESKKKYVAIHTFNSRILSLQNIKRIEKMLPDHNFLRVHKSYIVALDKIDTIERSTIFIGSETVPISETYRSNFFKILESRNLL